MKIGLNLLHARPEIGGGWNYIANVVQTLRLASDGFEFVAYCTPVSAAMVPDDSRFTVKIVDIPRQSQSYRVFYEQCVLPPLAYRDKVDCIHWFANNRPLIGIVPSVVTVHDFKFIERPFEVSRLKGLYLRKMAGFACRHADTLAPISEATAKAARQLFKTDPQRVIVIPNPVDDTFGPVSPDDLREFRDRLQLPPQFWLYVAHPYPHKNHERLLHAYKLCRDASPDIWPLLLRGDGGAEKDALDRTASELGIAESVVWIPRLSTEDMARLYSAATAMVFPSLYEGCGIPVLEAMACGCPVAASDIETTHEFAGDAALLFDAMSVDAIVNAMRQFSTDSTLRESCAARGLVKAKQYSPHNIAEKLCTAYRNAVTK